MKIEQQEEENQTLIPEDVILHSILPRLPIQYALRFQTVSKTWRCFIKRSLFTRLHHSFSKARNVTTFLIISSGRLPSNNMFNVTSIDVDNNTKMIQLPGQVCYEPVKDVGYVHGVRNVIGVCCGVFCISCSSHFLLWNPAIREVKEVEYSYSEFFRRSGMSCIGFGDVKDGDGNVINFKVLGMVTTQDRALLLFSVYSLNTNKWKLVKSPSFEVDGLGLKSGRSVCFNGVLYWLAWGRGVGKPPFVLTFDIASETFGRIDFPRDNKLILDKELDNFLTVLDGQFLVLAVSVKEGMEVWLNIWGLFEYGGEKRWERIDKTVGPLSVKRSLSISMLRYWAGGNAAIVNNGGRLCFHVEDKCREFETGFPPDMTCWEYVESLVSPRRISFQDDFQDID